MPRAAHSSIWEAHTKQTEPQLNWDYPPNAGHPCRNRRNYFELEAKLIEEAPMKEITVNPLDSRCSAEGPGGSHQKSQTRTAKGNANGHCKTQTLLYLPNPIIWEARRGNFAGLEKRACRF